MATAPPILIWSPAGGTPSGEGPTAPGPLPGTGITNADVTPLVNGQSYIDVVFDHIQTDTDWIFVDCSVENTTDPDPLNIWPGIITEKTTAGFRLQLNGMPDSDNYFLSWAISGINIAPTPATTFILSGPASGAVGSPATFTVHLPASTTGTATVTPSDGGDGGTFLPTSVTITTGAPPTTFTYTPGSAGTKTISVTNTGGLINPADITFVAIAYATGYSMSGPSGGVVGVASTPFTVTLTPLGFPVPSTVTVTPGDGGGGGTFTPTTAALTTAAPSATFTYTPASSGAKTISATNNGGLTNPGNLTYTVTLAGLFVNLISYWKLDEASGTRNDSFGTNHLTANNAPVGVAGIINNGAQFVTASSQYLSCASNSTLEMASNTDFTFTLWVKLTTLSNQVLIGKDDVAVNSRDYTIDFDSGSNTLRFYIKGGTTYIINSAGGSTGVWYFVVAWYDSSNGQLHLRVNDFATLNGPTGATGTDVSAAQFRIGARQYPTVEYYANAVIDEVGLWKRLLTPTEITQLYNGGAGLPFSSW